MRLLVLTFLICLLGGCGQSGALYLPEAPQAAPTAAPQTDNTPTETPSADADGTPAGSSP